ncbi:MAG: SDR family oxidoreductase [Gammaproteobacteria bacterium]|nr:SDR family oxidoreductase [Gammaproteobacteria bacterium]MYG12723.1 SDR family oxidoreductase [Gammaproteobacteria bacterium]MYK28875.1 SDR family oxidoreductase [Gammaproteobacteria bacterium]
MIDLADKVYLVTGATSGLGAATALLLAEQGAKVALAGRRVEKGQAVLDQIKAVGGEGIFLQTDVTVQSEVEAMVANTVDHFGQLDGAVNNAGSSDVKRGATADISISDWNRIIETNLNSVFVCMKYEVPALLESGGGTIVNMSSMYGLKGVDVGNAPYCASKWGVIGLTKTAAIDYGESGIRVNAVCPGMCESELSAPAAELNPKGFARAIRKHSAMNRLGEAREVADVIAWLLSSASSFVNGAAIPIDGGETTRMY